MLPSRDQVIARAELIAPFALDTAKRGMLKSHRARFGRLYCDACRDDRERSKWILTVLEVPMPDGTRVVVSLDRRKRISVVGIPVEEDAWPLAEPDATVMWCPICHAHYDLAEQREDLLEALRRGTQRVR